MHIHFVCTGNLYRGRLADDISRIEASEKAFAQITSKVDELLETLNSALV